MKYTKDMPPAVVRPKAHKPAPPWHVEDLMASHLELVKKVEELTAQVEWLRANHHCGDNR